MASQLLSAAKFGILAAIAFTGPKLITESGKYLARVEKRFDHDDESAALIHPASDEEFQEPFESVPESPRYANDSTPLALLPDQRHETLLRPISSAPSLTPADPSAAALSPADQAPGDRLLSDMPVITPLEKVLRFDLYPGSIAAIWPKVYADDSIPGQRGYRVSLLTGTQKDDLTGALCYWFDQRSLRRLTFGGQTGDFRKILAFLEYRYGMILDTESPPDEYRYRSSLERGARNPDQISRLNVRPAVTIDSSAPGENFRVDFELFRP